MKILFYINTIRHGGAERVISNLANQLEKKGHQCVFVTSFFASWEYKLSENVVRKVLNEKYIEGSFIKRNFCLLYNLRRILKEERPDVAIAFMAEPNFRLLISSVGLKVKKIISVRNDPKREYSNVITRTLAKILFCRADGIVFQTNEAQEWFPKTIQKKSKIILNQVDEIFYSTVYDGIRKNIVTTGRLVPQKNHKILIEAFSMISNLVSDDLIIYGEGELRNELTDLIKRLKLEKRIFLPGAVEKVSEKIKTAKLFVLSSDYEGLPNALMEAMALGIPCVSTDCPCGGPRMLLGNIDENLLVEPGNTTQLAEIMKTLVLSPDSLKNIGYQMKNNAKMFLPENVINVWEKYIIEVVTER